MGSFADFTQWTANSRFGKVSGAKDVDHPEFLPNFESQEMNFAYDNLSYATTQETHGANNLQSQPVFYTTNDSNQPKVLIDSNYTQYSPSSSSPPTPDNKENKIQGNSSDKMSSKKPLWAPGKPLSPKAQEMIKSGKGRPSDVPPFKWICLTCNRCLRDEWGLEQHIQTVHGARTFSCPHNCNKVFKRKDHLSMHVMTIHEGRKPCKTCKGTVTFKSKEELHQHKLQVHGSSCGSLVKPGSSSKIPSYKCEHCDFYTEKKDAMEEHKNNAHVEKPIVQAGVSATPAFRCGQCGWDFNSQYYLRLHIQQVHGVTNPAENGIRPTTHPITTNTTTSEYLVPGSSQLNYYDPQTNNIAPHNDIIQEVMGHDMFRGLHGDYLDDSLSGCTVLSSNDSSSSMKPLTPVNPHLTSGIVEGANVHMNFQNISNQYDHGSFTTLQPLNNPECMNYENGSTMNANLDINLCDMKSVGITY